MATKRHRHEFDCDNHVGPRRRYIVLEESTSAAVTRTLRLPCKCEVPHSTAIKLYEIIDDRHIEVPVEFV